jgi:transcriptional regulator with XRE-family HTH domain
MTRLPDRNLPGRPARVHNRVVSLMVHTDRYAFKGMSRLALDAGISKSALSRFIRGERRPSYLLVTRVVGALERELGRTIDPREVVTEEARYPTEFPCAVAGCSGCLPDWAYTEGDELKPEYRAVRPGSWTEPGIYPDLED